MTNEDFAVAKQIILQKYAIWKEAQVALPAMLTKNARVSIEMLASFDMVSRIAADIQAWALAEVHEAKKATEWRYRSWWDHFKATHFPAWLLKRYPAEKDTWTVFEPITVRVCPHISLPENDRSHLKFLTHE